MLHSYLVWSTLALSFMQYTLAFSPNHLLNTNQQRRQQQVQSNNGVPLAAVSPSDDEEISSSNSSKNNNNNQNNNELVQVVTRRSLLSTVATTAIAIFPLSSVKADDVESVEVVQESASVPAPSVPSYSIKKCPTPSAGACVSTSNVRQLDLYMPPWTFTMSPDEVMSRLKGAIVADPSCEIIAQDGSVYLKAQAKRADLYGSIDELEFIINADDQVVTFRSATSNNDKSDLGANKRRLEEIRKRAAIFGIMGANMNSADSKTNSEKGYGPFGQLKAFYGLQSGGGFEEINQE